jgi:hypothetical protein
VAASRGHREAVKLLLTHQKTRTEVVICDRPLSDKHYKGRDLLAEVVQECGLEWEAA